MAKFVSFDEEQEDVILERTDGKRTTIEFDVLRKIDQKYVRTFLGSEKTIHESLVPVCRTWRSLDGEFEEKATFLSGDEKFIFLKREDGETIKVEVSEISLEDQEYVQPRLAVGKIPPKNQKTP